MELFYQGVFSKAFHDKKGLSENVEVSNLTF